MAKTNPNDIYYDVIELPIDSAEIIVNEFSPKEKDKKLKILDLGTGRGAYSIPTIKSLIRNGYDFEWKGIEINEEYKKYFISKLKSLKISDDNVKIKHCNIGIIHGLKNILASHQFQIIIVSPLFHHVPNWRKALDIIVDSLGQSGRLILISVSGDWVLFTGDLLMWKKSIENPSLYQNLQEYWFKIYNSSPSNWRQLSAANIKPVLGYLDEKSTIQLINKKNIVNETKEITRDQLEIIFCGGVFSTIKDFNKPNAILNKEVVFDRRICHVYERKLVSNK